MVLHLDAWLEKLRRSEHLEEVELKSLCDYVKEILVEEGNVQVRHNLGGVAWGKSAWVYGSHVAFQAQ